MEVFVVMLKILNVFDYKINCQLFIGADPVGAE